ALALAQEALHSEKPGPFNDNPVGHTTSDWPLEKVLDWDKPHVEPRSEATDKEKDKVVVERVGRGAEEVLVWANVHEMPVAGVNKRLREQSNLRIEWATAARHQVEDRSLIVQVEKLPLQIVLRALAEPLGLSWQVKGPRLQFFTEREVSAEALLDLRLTRAR